MHRTSAPRRLIRLLTLGTVSLLLLLPVLYWCAPPASAQVPPMTRDDAIARVTALELGGTMDGVRLFVDPKPLSAGEGVGTWRRDLFRAPAGGWLVFVDRHPGANWEHPCSYFFVDGVTGAIERHDASTPPARLEHLIEITNGRDNPPPGVSEELLERYSERLRSLPKPPPARGQAWAFLISGGANASNNHIRYWNDMAFIYRTLVEYYGYADDHIRVCMSDGTSPAADRSDGTNSPTDLDGDGDADTEYPATLQYIGQVFGELAATLTPSDQLFIFTTDHGGQESGQDCYLNLWNWEQLRDDQMAAYVAALPCQSIICTFEQCYSGGMVDDLAGDGRVIATAAAWNELSWAMGPDYIYDTFVYHWTCAVGWETPSGQPVDADTNNDGLVSMREAFLYAEAHDNDNETPQYSSTPANLGEMLNLLGNLEGVYLALGEITIDDDNSGASSGNGNGVIDFGETIELTVALRNMGLSGADNVMAMLGSSSGYVTVVSAPGAYGAIPSEGTATNTHPFVFTVANDVPNGEPLGLSLTVNEEPGLLTLPLEAHAPAYVVEVYLVDDSSGDNDGIVDPGELVALVLRFANQGGCASPDITAALESGGHFTCGETPVPVGVLPAGGESLVGGFLVQVAPECPPIITGQLTLALAGPAAYAVTTGLRLPVGPWFDDAEFDFAWTLGVAGDNATSGQWVRADPVGTTYNGQPCQPEDDHTANPAHLCFVTGNGTVGGAAGEADVDGGKTTLLSPVFNLQDATAASISYWRWYTNNLGNSPSQDYWDVEVTADGSTWVPLEHTLESANSWTERTFDLAGVVPFTNAVRLRFVATDLSPGSLVEAAVDDIMVTIIRPGSSSGVNEGDAVLMTGLGACRPNPIGASATLSYRLPARCAVRIELYDVAGRHVRTLVDGLVEAGEQTLDFRSIDANGRRISSGIYFLRLETPEVTQIRQVAIVQ